jgi:hypothetical protein
MAKSLAKNATGLLQILPWPTGEGSKSSKFCLGGWRERLAVDAEFGQGAFPFPLAPETRQQAVILPLLTRQDKIS